MSVIVAAAGLVAVAIGLSWIVDLVLAPDIAAYDLLKAAALYPLFGLAALGLVLRMRGRYERALRRLDERTSRDQQTGLLHHAAFMQVAATRLARPDLVHHALLIGDIDRFKSINDTFGHQAGDAAIRDVSAVLVDLFGTQAAIGRLGGEEFAVLVSHGDRDVVGKRLTDLMTRAEDWRRQVAAQRVGDGSVTATISIGVAVRRPGEALADLYGRADRALYLAKALGRDRVVADDATASPDTTLTAAHEEIAWDDDLAAETGPAADRGRLG